jgi:hypothetical protein
MATIGALATFKDRVDIVKDVVKTIAPQIDLLMIYCNDEESYRNARTITDGNVKKVRGPNLTDRGKFYFCSELKGENHTYFAFDDDLLYPPDYVQHTLKELAKYNHKAIVSYHGKQLITRGVRSYYARQTPLEERHSYRVLGEVIGNHDVDLLGTGCMAFDLRYFCPENLKEDMMADIEVGCLAEQQHKRRIVLAHKMGWVTYHPKMQGKWTIWDEFANGGDERQTNLLNNTFL